MGIEKITLALLLLLALTPLTLAHETEYHFEREELPLYLSPSFFIIITGSWLILLTIIAVMAAKNMNETLKKILFWLMVIPVVLSTFYVAGHTVYENIISPTNGPVHWHADYEVWACGEKLDLIDPKFPKNKIGTPVLHEHNDDRIHLEGTPLSLDEATLGYYFYVINGELDFGHLRYDAISGYVDVENGDQCPDGQEGILKVWVNGEKIQDPAKYRYYPDPLVPPGDCVIIEFSPGDPETTDRICASWEVNGWTYDNYERKEVTIGEYTYR